MSDEDKEMVKFLGLIVLALAFLIAVIGVAVDVNKYIEVLPQLRKAELEREQYEHATKFLDSLVAPGLGIHVAPSVRADRPFNL